MPAVDARGERLDGRHLEGAADERGLGDIGEADARRRSLLRLDLEQPLLGQPGDGLGQRLARHAEAVADLGLVDALPGASVRATIAPRRIVIDRDRLGDAAARLAEAGWGRVVQRNVTPPFRLTC